MVVPIYFALPYRWRWLFLLAVSYYFYAFWNASYIILIALSTLIDYSVARMLGRVDNEQVSVRRLLLLVSILVNLGVLFVFKYFNFFTESFSALLGINSPVLEVLLPVGISFYTFQSMSYTIDVYRGEIEPETHLGIFATFIAFFPQLVAGPIERAGNMLPQFRVRVDFDYDRAVDGLRLVLWGAFKKVVIADRLAVYVNTVYNQPEHYSGSVLIVATVFFAVQIYCDFSGYSDIAIGIARVLGIRLMDNFRQPYFSQSIREFWRRWHISLSTWFRDYLYIPLGGNRASQARVLLNLMIVFVVSGLWHGANWTFVIWGAIHGLFIGIEVMLQRSWGGRFPATMPRLIKVVLTFSVVCFAWIFFRANSLPDALYVVTHLLSFSGDASLYAPFEGSIIGATREFALAWGLILVLIIVDAIDAHLQLQTVIRRSPMVVRWALYYVALGFIWISLAYPGENTAFIYFQF